MACLLPMHIILGCEFADGRDDSVKPPYRITLDSRNLILERAEHLKV